MSSTVFISTNEFLTYDDLQGHRAIQTLRQLNSTNPALAIKRKSSSQEILGYLVKNDFLTERLDTYEADQAAVFAFEETLKDANYLARNVSHIMDLLQGRVQVPSQGAAFAREGLSIDAFRVFTFEDTKAFYVDDADDVVMEPDTKRKGNILGYILHPAHYASLNTTPATGSYTGTGNGTISVTLKPSSSIAETLTFTATSATQFSVVGGDSGALGTATVGTLFDSVGFTALITAGSTPFIAGDEFTVESLAPVL